jgi:hypothetical protein
VSKNASLFEEAMKQIKTPCKLHINCFLNPKRNPKQSLFIVLFIKKQNEKHSLKKLDKLRYLLE